MAETSIVEQVAAKLDAWTSEQGVEDPRGLIVSASIVALVGEHIAQQIEAVRDGRGEPVEIIRVSHAARIARETGR